MASMAEPSLADVCTVWSAVFGRAVTPDDDYFLLGGDSLSAVEVSILIEERYDVIVDLVDFFEYSTPRCFHERIHKILAPEVQ